MRVQRQGRWKCSLDVVTVHEVVHGRRQRRPILVIAPCQTPALQNQCDTELRVHIHSDDERGLRGVGIPQSSVHVEVP